MTSDTHQHTNHCYWNPAQAQWVCREASATSDVARDDASCDRPLVDVRDMVVVHTAMLREFRLAPRAVTRVAVGDRKHARAVAKHIGFLCDMLHHHHDGEDELLWPKLRERTPEAGLDVIDAVEAQHRDLDAALSDVGDVREAWGAHAAAADRDLLAAHLIRLYALLSDHLELEERELLPLAASALTFDEWHAIGAAGVAAMPKSALVLAFGMFAYEGDPAVLRQMLKTAPPPARVVLPRVAPVAYARRARLVHGTARP